MGILEDIWQVHGGMITAAGIVGVFAVIGWLSDEWQWRKDRQKDKEKK